MECTVSKRTRQVSLAQCMHLTNPSFLTILPVRIICSFDRISHLLYQLFGRSVLLLTPTTFYICQFSASAVLYPAKYCLSCISLLPKLKWIFGMGDASVCIDDDRFLEVAGAFFVALMLGTPVVVLYNYSRDKLGLEWREWLTKNTLEEYLRRRNYYTIENAQNIVSTQHTHVHTPKNIMWKKKPALSSRFDSSVFGFVRQLFPNSIQEGSIRLDRYPSSNILKNPSKKD